MSEDINELDDVLEEGIHVDQNSMERLNQLAKKLKYKKIRMEELTKQVEDLTREIFSLETRDLPDVMDEIGMKEFRLSSGELVKVDSLVKVSIPKESEDKAFTWLRQSGNDDLIKRNVTVKLAKGQDAIGAKVVEAIKAIGIEPEDKQAVHWATLNSWAKEQLSMGKEIPSDIFSLFIGRKATIKI